MPLVLCLCVGILGRGYWTPDEPREADIAWRMSWQSDKAVPLLAGEAFCEKPPLTYWIAGKVIEKLGDNAWAARLPNLLYAIVTALAVASIGRRGAGRVAAFVAAAAISTFLLTYQVAIWLATDAPLLASVAVALCGLYVGFYADNSALRLRAYSCMHAALAVGFLSKSAAAWMVPVLTIITLIIWEKRWRELLRWELYVGLLLQAALILTWVWFVYLGPDGPAHLKVFFWNNLAGRFVHVDAPEALQYTGAHRNSAGKYFLELPLYLWPWTLLVMAAVRRAWKRRYAPADQLRLVRFGIATFLPTLLVLSLAATARNIYLAPAIPGVALLLGWWAEDSANAQERWDARALRGTSALLLAATALSALAVILVGLDSWDALSARSVYVGASALGILAAAACALSAWRAAGQGLLSRGLFGVLLAYSALLVGPASQIYRGVDAWHDFASLGRAIARHADGRPLILFTPDETTRAFIDMYAQPSVTLVPAPLTPASSALLQAQLAAAPQSWVLTQLPSQRDATLRELARHVGLGRWVRPLDPDPNLLPAWATRSGLRVEQSYALPHGRRYALLRPQETTSLH